MEQMYFIYLLDRNGDKKAQRVTDQSHKAKCVELMKIQYPNYPIHVNKAYMCFDGYLEQGDYMGCY